MRNAGSIVSLTPPSRATSRWSRRIVAVAVTTLIAACGKTNHSAPTVPPTVPPAAATTTTVSGPTTVPGSPTTTIGGASASTTVAPSASTSVDPSTVTTLGSIDTTQRFDFQAPPTDQKDVGMLDVYRNFMAVQEQIGLNLSDPGLRAQLAAITTGPENAALQKAFDDFVAQGVTYRVVESVTYHPSVLYGDGYRDGFRTVADCFIEAAAYVDSAGNPLPGQTLARASKGFVAEFELHDGKWLASASHSDPSNCLLSR